jgi:membrane-associated phospholipid phosphatase
MAIQPNLRSKRHRILIFSAGLVTALLLDSRIAVELSKHESPAEMRVANSITDIALAQYWILGSLVLAVLAAGGVALVRKETFKARLLNIQRWATHLFLALLGTGLVTTVMKLLVGRARPNAWAPDRFGFRFSPFYFGAHYQSFPSGHSQVIFCVSALLAYLWPKQRLVFFGLALVIALTRVLTLKHFASDVFAGMLIGIYGSRWSVELWERWVPAPAPLAQSSGASRR